VLFFTALPSRDLRLAQHSRFGAKQGNLFFSGSPQNCFSQNFVGKGMSKILIFYNILFLSQPFATIMDFCSQPLVENLV